MFQWCAVPEPALCTARPDLQFIHRRHDDRQMRLDLLALCWRQQRAIEQASHEHEALLRLVNESFGHSWMGSGARALRLTSNPGGPVESRAQDQAWHAL